MRYVFLLLLIGCAETVQHTPTQTDCGGTIEVLRGDCTCSLTVVYDADCRMTVVPVCPDEATIHELSVRQFPQSKSIDLEVGWMDGSTCKSIFRTVQN